MIYCSGWRIKRTYLSAKRSDPLTLLWPSILNTPPPSSGFLCLLISSFARPRLHLFSLLLSFTSCFWCLSCSDPVGFFLPRRWIQEEVCIAQTGSHNYKQQCRQEGEGNVNYTPSEPPVFAAWRSLAPETQTSVPSGLTCWARWQEPHMNWSYLTAWNQS